MSALVLSATYVDVGGRGVCVRVSATSNSWQPKAGRHMWGVCVCVCVRGVARSSK